MRDKPVRCARCGEIADHVTEIEVSFTHEGEEFAACTSFYHDVCLEELTDEEVVAAAQRHVQSALDAQRWMPAVTCPQGANAILN